MKKLLIAALIGLAVTWAGVNTEIDFGQCLNDSGDGRVYNADPEYNYISYRKTEAVTGDNVITLFFLNPLNMAPDDYIYRHDWIVRR